jgi:hypothetical protein
MVSYTQILFQRRKRGKLHWLTGALCVHTHARIPTQFCAFKRDDLRWCWLQCPLCSSLQSKCFGCKYSSCVINTWNSFCTTIMQLHTCECVTFIGAVLNILFTPLSEVSFTLVCYWQAPDMPPITGLVLRHRKCHEPTQFGKLMLHLYLFFPFSPNFLASQVTFLFQLYCK